jgi:hypothetical protein
MIILDDQDPRSSSSTKSNEAVLERSGPAEQSSAATPGADSDENTLLLPHADPPPAYTPSPSSLPQPAIAPNAMGPEDKSGSRAGLRFAKAFAVAVVSLAIFNVVEILFWRWVEAQVSMLFEPSRTAGRLLTLLPC